jgi:hypothetical protein
MLLFYVKYLDKKDINYNESYTSHFRLSHVYTYIYAYIHKLVKDDKVHGVLILTVINLKRLYIISNNYMHDYVKRCTN